MTEKKTYSTANLFIRSLLFSIYSISSMVIYSFVVSASCVLPLHYRFVLIEKWLIAYFFMLKHLCHITCKIEGLENIPQGKVGIVLSKHQSTLETFLLPLIFKEPAVIAKRELLFIPFFGWGLAASDPIAINRSNKKSAMQQIIDKGKKCLAAGRYIMMFPEGTRVPVGQVGNYRLGGARLAAATGYPVFPVAHNAGRFWPRRKFLKYPGTVHMVIGPPIESKDRTPEEILSMTKDWIETTVTRIDSLVDKSTS